MSAMLQIYNSKDRKKEPFKPVHEGEARIYACGPTVYDYFHVGNARMFVVFDAFRRYLRYRGYKVTFVQNFTDIDDKMIRRANAEGITVKELADRFIKEYFIDAQALGIEKADVHPRATEHIPEIIELIKRLEANGYAYQTEDGVYFDTHAYRRYGLLSGQDLDELESGARIEVDENKRHPADFALWKAYKEGEPYWDSPWGKGRPGWHIECSAMSMKYLGETIDFHCGGQDLLFPHHENETAQAEGATGKTFVNYWMHNGFINVDNEKMSKSAGNFFTIREIAKQYSLEVVRFFLLSAHYRSPFNFSRDMVEQAGAALERLKNARGNYEFAIQARNETPLSDQEKAFIDHIHDYETRFCEALDDDFNTAGAIGVLFEFAKDANLLVKPESNFLVAQAALDMLTRLCGILGILQKQQDDVMMKS